jgi:hypothetical protein
MSSIAEQLALRDRLQTIEDRLLLERYSHVIAKTSRGMFEWVLPRAVLQPADYLEIPELADLENEFIDQEEAKGTIVTTEYGTFFWEPDRPVVSHRSQSRLCL